MKTKNTILVIEDNRHELNLITSILPEEFKVEPIEANEFNIFKSLIFNQYSPGVDTEFKKTYSITKDLRSIIEQYLSEAVLVIIDYRLAGNSDNEKKILIHGGRIYEDFIKGYCSKNNIRIPILFITGHKVTKEKVKRLKVSLEEEGVQVDYHIKVDRDEQDDDYIDEYKNKILTLIQKGIEDTDKKDVKF